MQFRKLPNGVEVYGSKKLSEHVRMNQYFLSEERGYGVSLFDALIDLFQDSGKLGRAIMGGLEVPEKLLRCDGCGRLYTTDWELVGEYNGMNIHDGEIPVNYSYFDSEVFHYIDSIKISGNECVSCLRSNEVLEKRSRRKAEKDPLGWVRSLGSFLFPHHANRIPEEAMKKINKEGLLQGS